jgi:hypothetical protein
MLADICIVALIDKHDVICAARKCNNLYPEQDQVLASKLAVDLKGFSRKVFPKVA